MRKLPDEVLPPEIQHVLDVARDELDRVGDYAARVRATDQHWKRARARVVNPVRDVLRAMCGEVEPCCYCESSVGVQVDHVRPRSFYPELTFEWLNLLLACGRCNSIKKDRFGVLVSGEVKRVIRSKHGPIEPPPNGQIALIDLRREDPLEFFKLDLEIGIMRPRRELDALGRARAEFTRRILRLNDSPLPTWRVNHFGTFKARLEQYVNRRDRDPQNPGLQGLRAELLRLPHQMVWQEMKRQHSAHADLRELFTAAPEALDW